MAVVFGGIQPRGPRRGRSGGGEGGFNLGVHGGLIVFDRQDIIPTARDDRLRNVLLTPHRIRRHDFLVQVQEFQ